MRSPVTATRRRRKRSSRHQALQNRNTMRLPCRSHSGDLRDLRTNMHRLPSASALHCKNFDLVRRRVPCNLFKGEGTRRIVEGRHRSELGVHADLYPLECIASVRMCRPSSQLRARGGGTLRHAHGHQPSNPFPGGVPWNNLVRAQERQGFPHAGDVGGPAGTLRGVQQTRVGVPQPESPGRAAEDHGGGLSLRCRPLANAQAATFLRQRPRDRRQHLDRDRPERLQ